MYKRIKEKVRRGSGQYIEGEYIIYYMLFLQPHSCFIHYDIFKDITCMQIRSVF